jgi:hypothetical protein
VFKGVVFETRYSSISPLGLFYLRHDKFVNDTIELQGLAKLIIKYINRRTGFQYKDISDMCGWKWNKH